MQGRADDSDTLPNYEGREEKIDRLNRELAATTGVSSRELREAISAIMKPVLNGFQQMATSFRIRADKIDADLIHYQAVGESRALARAKDRAPRPPKLRAPPPRIAWPARMQEFRCRTKSRKGGPVVAMSSTRTR